jgi:hypothetical protein
MKASERGPLSRRATRGSTVWVIGALAFLLLAPVASASKQVIAYFGTESGAATLGGQFTNPGDVAVNTSGNGPANLGDIYVLDGARVQRFAQDDNGTSSNPYDDSYVFLSAWGAGVETGGSDYQICNVAPNCHAGSESEGNGGLRRPQGIAVDQDTGQVYVADTENHRVAVYSGDGLFLRAFGYDVVESGPDESGVGFEVCVAANGDVCKAGTDGAAVGQIGSGNGIAVSTADGNAASGTVFLGDSSNLRVDTYNLDGSSPSSFGSGAQFGSLGLNSVAVDSRGIVYISDHENDQEVDRYDSQNANGGGIGFLQSISSPPLKIGNNNGTVGLEVDPDPDGPGPEVDVLYVLRTYAESGVHSIVQQFGPVNAPGLTASPTEADETSGDLVGFNFTSGLGLDTGSGRLFVTSFSNVGGDYNLGGPGTKSGVYVLDKAGGAPSAVVDSITDVSATTAKLHATVNPNGGPPVTFRVEYSIDGVNWSRTAEVTVGSQESPQAVEMALDPPGTGLEPNTLYHVRIVATKDFTPPVTSSELTFTTERDAPLVATVGSPLRTAQTAQLEGRVNPRHSVTTYHFEYGRQGPCASNPCIATPSHPAGSSGLVELVSQDVSALQPDTTYYYRVVAESSAPGSPSSGEDRTLTTRASDQVLGHGHFPGPPGSDRAYEQVNAPDSGGNPVTLALSAAFADDGDRATYGVAGGTPFSDTASAFNQFFAQRSETGPHQGSWQTKTVFPPRGELAGTNWFPPAGRSDLSQLIAANFSATGGGFAVFRISPSGPATKLFEVSRADYNGFVTGSDDGSAALLLMNGSQDPAHPAVEGGNLYDISSGSAELVNLLPDGTVPPCGVRDLPDNMAQRAEYWIAADAARVYFSSLGAAAENCDFPTSQEKLYVRELDAGVTKLISAPSLSGLECDATFVKSTPTSAFFWTRSRLDSNDTAPKACRNGDGDIYNYDLASGALECVTCATVGLSSDIDLSTTAHAQIAVAPDGSRVYFKSPNRLLPGAAAPGIYRADVASGSLAYVGPAAGAETGENAGSGNAINHDGSVFVFRSNNLALNALNGADNGGSEQYYRYDDDDRSLVCVSCPQDGGPAETSVPAGMLASPQAGPNATPLDNAGDLIFRTSQALLGADQNTPPSGQGPEAGEDIYEWRDGRLLLVTDGVDDVQIPPEIGGVTPSGRDIFFVGATQYTPDALDGYSRLYDARIGGGFDFAQPPKPCPLEVCQGTPQGVSEEAVPGTGSNGGHGNLRPSVRARARKHKHGKKRHKKKHQHRINHERGMAR